MEKDLLEHQTFYLAIICYFFLFGLWLSHKLDFVPEQLMIKNGKTRLQTSLRSECINTFMQTL